MGDVSNNSVNIASGVGPGPLSLWKWLAPESSLRAQCAIEQYEDFQRPQQRQKHGSQCEKAAKQ